MLFYYKYVSGNLGHIFTKFILICLTFRFNWEPWILLLNPGGREENEAGAEQDWSQPPPPPQQLITIEPNLEPPSPGNFSWVPFDISIYERFSFSPLHLHPDLSSLPSLPPFFLPISQPSNHLVPSPSSHLFSTILWPCQSTSCSF